MWPGETVVIAASGPSLQQEDLAMARGRARVVVINDSYLYAPWADIHYICDKRLYDWHRQFQSPAQQIFGKARAMALWHGFAGLRVVLESAASCKAHEPALLVLRNDSAREGGPSEPSGLCEKPDGVRTGRNSGYQAINLAYHTGATRILLLGYNMQVVGGKSHWFGEHPQMSKGQPVQQAKPSNPSAYQQFADSYESLAGKLKAKGVSVINCTADSALKAFKRGTLADCL
jgi:hypothetical protein